MDIAKNIGCFFSFGILTIIAWILRVPVEDVNDVVIACEIILIAIKLHLGLLSPQHGVRSHCKVWQFITSQFTPA